MKKTLFTALAVPFMIAIPVVAHADPGGPPAIFTPQQVCDSTGKMVKLVHQRRPDAKTPDQILDAYDQILAQGGVDMHVLYPDQRTKDISRKISKENMTRCNLH